jgi:4-amino-4-deoxy-L-arabinose transferase-like glycosyltransferase
MQKSCSESVDAAASNFLRRHWRFFLLFSVIAFAFRLWFLFRFRMLTADTFVYGDIARNWLESGIYAISGAAGPEATYIRMPGYPAFLAGIWKFAGMEHYTAALIVQMFIDIGTCFLIADLGRRMFLPVSSPESAANEGPAVDLSSRASAASEGSAFRNVDRAPLIAFALAAVCPFFASYSSAALTECLAIFFAALAFDLALAALEQPHSKPRWIACGLALAGGIFMRPDGGILLAAIGAYILWRFIRTHQTQLIAGLVLVALFSLAPLVPWTIRNWRLYHLFQPLTPMAANAPDEFVAHGFDRWTRTWIADYSSLEDIGFRVPLEEIDIADLPPRAFDSAEQRAQTEQLFDEYNNGTKIITPQLDFRFAQLADQRIRDSRFRYYVWLPVARLGDLWLRPRTEMLPIDVHWWRYWEDPHDFALALLLAVINAFYLIAALIGATRWRGCLQGLGIVLLFVLIRSLFLMYLSNPEPRYMLECYPAVIALAGWGLTSRRKKAAAVGDSPQNVGAPS